jgi:hypothetical protein
MKGTEHGLYCTVEEAAFVLGMNVESVRKKMKDGTLNIGTMVKKRTRTVFMIRRDLVAKAAGLDEFPSEAITVPKSRMAESCGLLLKQNGFDKEAVGLIADVMLESKIITPYQREKMAGVM